MAAALVLSDESIDDVDAFAAALEAVGLKAWDSTLRAARTFQGRIEGAGGWERVNLDTQLEWMAPGPTVRGLAAGDWPAHRHRRVLGLRRSTDRVLFPKAPPRGA